MGSVAESPSWPDNRGVPRCQIDADDVSVPGVMVTVCPPSRRGGGRPASAEASTDRPGSGWYCRCGDAGFTAGDGVGRIIFIATSLCRGCLQRRATIELDVLIRQGEIDVL